MVGAILLPALARQPRILPPRFGHRRRGRGEQDDPEVHHPLLPPLLHPLHQEAVRQAQEEVPHHAGDHQDWHPEVRRGREDRR